MNMTFASRSQPYYIQLADHYRQLILSGAVHPGERLEAEPEIAQRFGLARGTVRHALEILVAEGLLVSVRGKGTFACQQAPRECGKLVGLIMPFIHDALGAEILKGVEARLRQDGYSLIFGSSEGDLAIEREQIHRLQSNQVCGLILMPSAKSREGVMVSQGFSTGIPLVVVDREVPGYPAASVFVDNCGGARKAVEHLIQLGHRQVGCITHKGRISSVEERVRGYDEAMRAAGLLPLAPIYLDWHGPTSQGLPPAFDPDEMNPIDQMLQSPARPTAFFCVNDFTAGAVMQHILLRGFRIPEDVALVGFDDIPLAPFLPVPLTTVSQPRYEIGLRAATLLITQILGGQDEQARVILPTELVVRDSSGSYLPGHSEQGSPA
jgi:GntR family transcriptional regulator, arabinose operon transcriptional repressor